MDTTDTITVQDSGATASAPPPVESSGWTSLVPMVLIFVVFYFLLIRPQEKKRRNQETLVAGVKKGEEVMTSYGLFGVVNKINDSDNTVMLQIAKDVEVKMLKTSIADIISRNKKVEDSKDLKQVNDKSTVSAKQKKK